MNILYIIGFLLLFGAIGGSENGNLTILQCLLLSAIAFIILIVTMKGDINRENTKTER